MSSSVCYAQNNQKPTYYRYASFNLPAEGEPGYATTTTHAIATANGVFSAGGAVGALFIMWSCDQFGRKRNIQLGALLCVIGGALQGGAAALDMFQVGRFVCGAGECLLKNTYFLVAADQRAGIGILVTVCPMYLSEMSSPHVRGWLVGHHPIFLVFGYILSAWVGYGCYFATPVNPSFAWRFP